MSNALRSELSKLTTVRTTLAFLVATAGVVLLAVVLQAATAGGEFLGGLDDPATQRALFLTGEIATVIAVVFGTLGISGEFRHRTIVPSLLVTPGRIEMVVAKTVAAAAGGAAIGLAAVIAAALGTAGVLLATGTSVTVDLGPVAAAWAGTVGAAAIGSWLGLGVGGILRNQALAVGAVLLVLLVVEPLISSLAPDLGPWLSSSLANAIADPAEATPNLSTAVAVYGAYGLALTAGAAAVLRRADVS